MKFLWSLLKRQNKKNKLRRSYAKLMYSKDYKFFVKHIKRLDSIQSPVEENKRQLSLYTFCLPLKIDKTVAKNIIKRFVSPVVMIDKDTYCLSNMDNYGDDEYQISDIKQLSKWNTIVDNQIDSYIKDNILVKHSIPNLTLVNACHYFLIKNKFVPHGFHYLKSNTIQIVYSRQSMTDQMTIRRELFSSFLMDLKDTVSLILYNKQIQMNQTD